MKEGRNSARRVIQSLRVLPALALGAVISARLKMQGHTVGDNLRLYGRPKFRFQPRSHVRIGRRVTIASTSGANPLGISHAAVIRTLAPGAEIVIGDDVGISGGSISSCYSIRIGDGCLIGADVHISDTDFHPIHSLARRYRALPEATSEQSVSIGRNAFVGAGSFILKGVQIGEHAVVGAGSVVRSDVPDRAIVTGNPATIIGAVRDE